MRATTEKLILLHRSGPDPGVPGELPEPFATLRARLGKIGYALAEAADHPVASAEWILFWNYEEPRHTPTGLQRFKRRIFGGATGTRALHAECVAAGLQWRTALFTAEPEASNPRNWETAIHDRFGTVFTWHDRLVDGRRYHKFRPPVGDFRPRVKRVSFCEKKLLVSYSDKLLSPHPKDLHAIRRQAIRHFERSQTYRFDLFGQGWDTGRDNGTAYVSYRGPGRSLEEVYPRFRFGLCYESMRDEPGWITQQVFDCMRADCVPVYRGASNVEAFIDPDAFVDRRHFRSDAELERYLTGVTEAEYEGYREAVRRYLNSERFAAFLAPAFAEAVVSGLRLEPETAVQPVARQRPTWRTADGPARRPGPAAGPAPAPGRPPAPGISRRDRAL